MQNALVIRLWSLAVPLLLCVVGCIFFPGNTEYWTFLLVVAIGLGYIHFFVATFYQVTSYTHHPARRELVKWFFLLALFALVVCFCLIVTGHTVLLALLSVLYFVAHVFLNERTFLARSMGITVSYMLVTASTLSVVPLFVSGLAHPSFMYDFSLQFPGFSPNSYLYVVGTYVSYPLLLTLAKMVSVISVVWVPALVWHEWKHRVATLLATGAMVASALWVLFGPPANFVFVLQTVLIYHFVLLSVLFYTIMRRKSMDALRTYLVMHGAVGLPVVIFALFYFYGDGLMHNISTLVFQFQLFVIISLVHITVSFLNEPWFRRLVNIV